jgi:cytidine deaminase
MMKDFTIHESSDRLDAAFSTLLEKAKQMMPHAYAPYSHFRVSAVVLLEDGTLVTGTNQENAAYPSGICAERLAVFTANHQYPEKKIKKILIIAQRKDETVLTPATSCGSCRQVMLEAENRQGQSFEIAMCTQPNKWVVAPSAASLLPFGFSKRNLH